MEPTIRPWSNFDAENDCKALRAAMKGLGTDEDAVMSIIINRSIEQRRTLEKTYKQMLGRDLIKDLKSELSGKFERVILGIFLTPTEYDCEILRKSVKGLGTNEKGLIDILCTRTNEEIRLINEEYPKRFNKKTLEKDITGDTSGHLRHILVSMTAANRSDVILHDKIASDVKLLYEAGEKKLGTNEEQFNYIMASRSYEHLREVYFAYRKQHGKDFFDVINSEFSGYIKLAHHTILTVAVHGRQRAFAEMLYTSMKGAGTDDARLIRTVVSRSSIDLKTVKQVFYATYKQGLENMINSDTSGDYRKALMMLAQGN